MTHNERITMLKDAEHHSQCCNYTSAVSLRRTVRQDLLLAMPDMPWELRVMLLNSQYQELRAEVAVLLEVRG